MILNGAGDPRTLSPVPNGTNDKLYVDDLTGTVYSAVGFPPTWTPVTPPLVGTFDATGLSANLAQFTLFTPTVTGMYEMDFYAVVTQAATTSSTLPQGQMQWNDPDSATQVAFAAISATSTTNTVGTSTLSAGGNSRLFYAQAGQPVNVKTTGYATSGATPMLFAVHIRATLVSN